MYGRHLQRRPSFEMMEYYLLSALLYAECTAGIAFNLFIVATNFQNWRTLKIIQTSDKILICLASSRSLFFIHMMVLDFLLKFYPPFLVNLLPSSSMLVGSMFLNHINFWFATVLCVFYCVKITNYNSSMFTFLKTRISSLVHWLLLASLPVSVAFSLPCGWFVFYIDQSKSSYDLHLLDSVVNATLTKVTVLQDLHLRFLMFIVHIRHMRRSRTGFGSPNLEVHYCAVKNMSLFLVLHVVYFVCMTVRLSPMFNMRILWRTLVIIITCIPPCLHSLYIIISTKKLKETFLRWFSCSLGGK
ncbi:taste receptor type 2 member 39-like [Engystomops pustulosus]|uniref:taste receptor type 2 member 39-like n=1 Tax=Engystomops pustulosus TaxID=76066 RepID=UPI003AFB5B39